MIGLGVLFICSYYAEQPEYYKACSITMVISGVICFYFFAKVLFNEDFYAFQIIMVPLLLIFYPLFMMTHSDGLIVKDTAYIGALKEKRITEISVATIKYNATGTELTPLVTYDNETKSLAPACKQTIKSTTFYDEKTLVSFGVSGRKLTSSRP